MWKHAGIMGVIYASFFQLYFLYTSHRWSMYGLFVLVCVVTAFFLHRYIRTARVRGSIATLFFLVLFAVMILYVSIVEMVWLRYVAALGFSMFAGTLLLLLSSGKGDIRSRPASFITAMMLMSVLLLLFSSAFFHSLKLFFPVRSIVWAIGLAVSHALVAYVSFFSFRFAPRLIVPTALFMFLISFQGFWVLEFLPFGSFTLGVFQAIPSAFFILIERDRLLDEMRPSVYIRLCLFAVVAIALILFITRWS